MTEREKVLIGLECCDEYLGAKRACDECPYGRNKPVCEDYLHREAAKIVKLQLPRLISINEAEAYEVVYLEIKGQRKIRPCHVWNRGEATNIEQFGRKGVLYNNAAYGREWRLWTASPSEAQRKAAEWHEH